MCKPLGRVGVSHHMVLTVVHTQRGSVHPWSHTSARAVCGYVCSDDLSNRHRLFCTQHPFRAEVKIEAEGQELVLELEKNG